MSTEFDSKQSALYMACVYAGVGVEALDGVTPVVEKKYHPLDDEHLYPQDVEVYTIKNRDGADTTFAVGKFRGGFDLWFVAENGCMVRV
jgi:hypothetical protein